MARIHSGNAVMIKASLGALLLLGACTTNEAVDPRQDSLWSSMKCVGGGCENYTDAQAATLGYEQERTESLQSERVGLQQELEMTEEAVEKLKADVGALDASIAKLQEATDAALEKASDTRPQLVALQEQLASLRAEARALEFEAQRTSAEEVAVRKKLDSLEAQRSLLQQTLEASI